MLGEQHRKRKRSSSLDINCDYPVTVKVHITTPPPRPVQTIFPSQTLKRPADTSLDNQKPAKRNCTQDVSADSKVQKSVIII